MSGKFTNSLTSNLKYDISSGIVVFLVALPLCLGIALASGAELFTGVITGIVGGILVGALSGSQLAVSGPAAGLAVIVMTAIHSLGNYQYFLVAVVISGFLQLILGYLKAGTIGNFFPSSVIKGMLAAIGVILILKQIPHALGDDLDYFGNVDFQQWDKKNTFSEILVALKKINPTAVVISSFSLILLMLWQTKWLKKLSFIPAPLLVVIAGVLINQFIKSTNPTMALGSEHLVSMPVSGSFSEFTSNFIFPDFAAVFSNSDLLFNVLKVAGTLAIIASIETLLSIEAVDKLDPQKRNTPTNRELKAQGVGNIVAGFIGGLPMTAVIVRGSANVAAGARTKMSAILHGIFLLLSLLFIPRVLNMIPLASLAAILFMVGYKLTSVGLFKQMYKKGLIHLVPFVVTIVAIVFTDLLIGISIGMIVSLVFILFRNMKNPFLLVEEPENENRYYYKLSQEISFLNKSSVLNALYKVPKDSHLIIDATSSKFIDDDVLELIEDFSVQAKHRNIKLEILGLKEFSEEGEKLSVDVPEKMIS